MSVVFVLGRTHGGYARLTCMLSEKDIIRGPNCIVRDGVPCRDTPGLGVCYSLPSTPAPSTSPDGEGASSEGDEVSIDDIVSDPSPSVGTLPTDDGAWDAAFAAEGDQLATLCSVAVGGFW